MSKKNRTVKITVRIREDVHQRAAKAAKDRFLSLNGFMEAAAHHAAKHVENNEPIL